MERPFVHNLRIPVATYRVQFNGNFRFADAASIIPYLSELGISDIYASPYLAARPGSHHGYDITDPTRINREIGTQQEYDLFIDELKRHGMGQLLDIVPNHMCITGGENSYWMDVMENGPSSSCASFFDIDWDPVKDELLNKVLLPFLGDQYGNVLENGEIRLVFEEGSFFISFYDHRLPVLPETYRDILALNTCNAGEGGTNSDTGLNELLSIVTAIENLPPYTQTDPGMTAVRNREKEIIKKRLFEIYQSDGSMRALIDSSVDAFNGTPGDPESFDLLDGLLSKQIYRLSYWQVATEEINYRRFFDINGLASIRVEEPAVFEETHRLIFDLIQTGKVTGLRVDHPDGLYNPSEYFDRLQRRCFTITMMSHVEKVKENVNLPYGNGYIESAISKRYDEMLQSEKYYKPFYIVAEKILCRGETMPAEWPLFSTTGYVFLNSLCGLFVDSRNVKAFDAIYRKFTRERMDFQEIVYENKKLVMQVAMSSEVNTLGHHLNLITEQNRQTRDFTLNSLIKAIIEVIACFPVYRTYITGPDVTERDRHYIELAVSRAARKNSVMNESIFLFMKDVLLLKFHPGTDDKTRNEWLNFTMKFQQVTGPVMAKGVEDTAFYVYNRLVCLNEVGGSPDRFGTLPDTFHGQNIERNKNWPYALITSATHDTKRGEDVRARISVLSEIPGEWQDHLLLWSKINKRKKIIVNNLRVPDRNEEYLLYQTLLGSWPFGEQNEEEWDIYKRRIRDYMIKAVKEAKVNTSWINPDRIYEEALTVFIDNILDRNRENPFLSDFLPFQRSAAFYGMFNSVSQTILKICAPGIPDFYQGTELWDLSLVDPDNRRPVDFVLRARMLDEMKHGIEKKDLVEYANELTKTMQDGRIKLYATYRALQLRKEMRELFEKGEYIPLEAIGIRSDHVIAFARRYLDTTIITAVPRFLTKILPVNGALFHDIWEDTMIVTHAGTNGQNYINVLTGETITQKEKDGIAGLACRDIFRNFPVALLESVYRPT